MADARTIEFREHPLGESYDLPEDAREGAVVTKLRYFRPAPPGQRRVKMTAVVRGLPSNGELQAARLVAIADGGDDVDIFILRMGWSGIQEMGQPSSRWIPARDFPVIRRDGTTTSVEWEELDRRR